MFDVNKLVVIGTVIHHGELKKCIMVLNLLKRELEKIKILSLLHNQTINCIQYGPYDNGHILLGLSDGWLLGFEYPTLSRIECKQVFKSES